VPEHDDIADGRRDGPGEELGIPYQTLINLFLKECAAANKRTTMTWRPAAKSA